MVNEGVILKADFIAREKETKEVFDTSIEEEAKKAGIFNEKIKYSPLVFIIGEKEILPALEEEIKKMKKGEEKEIVLSSDKAFGERNADFIKVIPLQEFRNRNINPFPGLVVEANNMHGRVQAVSGGRVRVDFNHPLAGKTVVYEVKLLEQISDEQAKSEAIFSKYFDFLDKSALSLKGKEAFVSITGQKGLDAIHAVKVKRLFSRKLMKITGIEKVIFQEEYSKEERGKKEPAAETGEEI